MITIQKITTSDTRWYTFTEQLMVVSFPVEEYRELENQRILSDENTQFAQHIILEDGNPIGFIALWNFINFLFIEHFAIDSLLRNRGLGSKVIQQIIRSEKLPILLETELPFNEINRRRIAFYNRNGFQLWERDYLQPPYRRGNPQIALCLMTTAELNPFDDFERVKSTLYSEVYGINQSQVK
jgi:ribosomal protein S18 acetylase RimI-like enzyme